jgi:hypothetical protein
VGINYNGLF